MVGYGVIVFRWLALAIAFVALINKSSPVRPGPAHSKPRGSVVFRMFWAAFGVLLTTYLATLV
jgi:hypothetical protein